MSAPSIPNLLSLRGKSGGPSRRGRPGPGPGSSRTSGASAASHDAVVQGTDDDAAVSRLSAVELGYLTDPFAGYFAGSSGGRGPTRRLPIINRGTYTRTWALDRLVAGFLRSAAEVGRGAQIVSLGAGTDTRALRLFAQRQQQRQQVDVDLVYHEVDFPRTAAQKLATVRAHQALLDVLPDPREAEGASGAGQGAASVKTWTSAPGAGGRYFCHGVDLRHLGTAAGAGEGDVELSGLRAGVPTLLLSECCLCYLEAHEARRVVAYFAGRVADLGVAVYEPVRPDDAFGRMMVSNLAARGIRMPTLEEYRAPQDQEERLRTAGLEKTSARTVAWLWGRWVPEEEKARVDRLEGLDEVEEWELLADHYVIAWGWRGEGFAQWESQDLKV
ncbi:hypothetical protein BROUX41_001537 [Berkeleyomyces rouxiae]|uniref:uncharacterized protein n=1 Tax=Berkeleyomyces rouxiae TaxID=2035830 RepID=UPI003B7CCFEB